MEEMIKAMSLAELEILKGTFETNPSAVAILDGYIAGKVKEEAQAKAKKLFADGIAKLFAKLPHPDDVLNIYAYYAVDREEQIPGAKGEEVEVVKADGSKAKETRFPTHKITGWVVEVNKPTTYAKGATKQANGNTNKRAIIVSRRESPESSKLVLVGHFPSASKACEHLKLNVGADSANRVLAREGYFLEPYTGSNYTIA